jgi:hypothetical protein
MALNTGHIGAHRFRHNAAARHHSVDETWTILADQEARGGRKGQRRVHGPRLLR